jgi:hypothetical protein
MSKIVNKIRERRIIAKAMNELLAVHGGSRWDARDWDRR